MLALVALAGCVDTEPGPDPVAFPLEIYRFNYEGSDNFVPGVDHGWLFQVRNPSNQTQSVSLLPTGVSSGVIGPISQTGGTAPQTAWLPGRIENDQFGSALTLAPGASGLFLARIASYEGNGPEHTVAVRAIAVEPDVFEAQASSSTLRWTVTDVGAGTPVVPGDHVQTVTVGVWLNGTSFYSNAAGALKDPGFPHGPGWTTPQDDTAPLPAYVYDADASEQPAGSMDTCHYAMIAGYNGLMKTQAEGSTNVALLRPEAAYTAEGREEHPLYGDSLVFLNTVVAHDGATGLQDTLPAPTGGCFPASVLTAAAPVTELLPV